jgi:hypothetical protein
MYNCKQYYRHYKSLERSWEWNNAPDNSKKYAFKQILKSQDPILVREEMQRLGYGSPNDDQWKKALKLRDAILSIPSGTSEDEPLADVYQAALRMETSEDSIWRGFFDKQVIFRGQRKFEYKMTPLLFRVESKAAAYSTAIIIAKLFRITI